jgi:hypothetical protein
MVLCRIIAVCRPFATVVVLSEAQVNSDAGAVASSEAANPNSFIVAQTDGTIIGKDTDSCKTAFILDNAAAIKAAGNQGDVSFTIERVS